MSTRYKVSDWSMAVGISLIGIALMVLGAFSYWDNDKISQAGITTTATVVDVKVSRSRTGGGIYRSPRRTAPIYTPVVRYVDATGTPQIGTSAVRSIEDKSLQKGDSVTITYNPAEPEAVLLQGENGKGGPITSMVAGVLLTLVGGWIVHEGVKKSK